MSYFLLNYTFGEKIVGSEHPDLDVHSAWVKGDMPILVSVPNGEKVYGFVPVTYSTRGLHSFLTDEELIYDRIWVTELLEFGTITELDDAEIEVWNANFYSETSITSFTDPGHSGISIDTVSTPVALTYNESALYTVSVSPTGPSQQYTIYEWVVGGLDFETLVTGERTLAFPFKINWKDDFYMGYKYNTIIFQSKTGHEQRRDYKEGIVRSIRGSILLEKVMATYFIHLMRGAASRLFVVPVYGEEFYCNSSPTGKLSITSAIDLSYFWNLNNYCTNLIIVDHNTGISEVKTVESISGDDITFTTEVVSSFTSDATLYPAFLGMLNNYSYEHLTDGVLRAEISFGEEVHGE